MLINSVTVINISIKPRITKLICSLTAVPLLSNHKLEGNDEPSSLAEERARFSSYLRVFKQRDSSSAALTSCYTNEIIIYKYKLKAINSLVIFRTVKNKLHYFFAEFFYNISIDHNKK